MAVNIETYLDLNKNLYLRFFKVVKLECDERFFKFKMADESL